MAGNRLRRSLYVLLLLIATLSMTYYVYNPDRLNNTRLQTHSLDFKHYENINSSTIPSFSTMESPSKPNVMTTTFPKMNNLSRENMNSAELSRFRDRLLKWPSMKPKAAVYFLLQAKSARFDLAVQCIFSLDKYFNKQYQYPVIVFHEGLPASHIKRLQKESSSDLYFQQVSFAIPSHVNKSQVHAKTMCSRHPIGYRHMCRFHCKLVFEQPIMSHLEYYWRLDDDSRITRPITYDLFQFMAKNNFLYGYTVAAKDSHNCVYKLWEYTKQHIEKQNITTSFFGDWTEGSIYYNNFEVSALSLWTSTSYKEYIDFIDRLGGIYYYRWGDAPIKSIAVSMFAPKRQIHHFKDIGYHHQHINIP